MKKLISVLCAALCLLCLFPTLALGAEETESAVPAELVGTWLGVGVPKNGGPSIDLSVCIRPNGAGTYTFDQGSYHESRSFNLEHDSNTFTVTFPEGRPLERVDGAWELKDGALLLDITSTLTGGGTYSYTAECGRFSAPGFAEEYTWLSYPMTVDAARIIPGNELDRSLSDDRYFAEVRMLAKDGPIKTEDLTEENLKQFVLTDSAGKELPSFSYSYWGVGFDMAKGGFFTDETQEGFFLYFDAEKGTAIEDLTLTVKAA